MKKISKTIIRRKYKDDDEAGFDFEQAIKDITTLASIASMSKNSSKLSKSMGVVSGSLSVASLGKNILKQVQAVMAGKEYKLKLEEDDFIYGIAEMWLMKALPDDEKKSVYMKTVWEPQSGDRKALWGHKVQYDGSIQQDIVVSGYSVRVGIEKKEGSAPKQDGKPDRFAEPLTIVFTCPSAEARDAVKSALSLEAVSLRAQTPGFYTNRWGSFYRSSSVANRPKDSVILKEGQMDRIIDHIRQFRRNEQEYDKLGIPFRTGIMFSGTPGSGKTSTATAVANELSMDVYYLSVLSMDGDSDLENSISRVPDNSMVVIEDIDAIRATKDRDSDSNSDGPTPTTEVSLSGLLNVLDGMQSPRGVVFVLTTNHPEKLDPAIIRPGRVDLHENLTALDSYQLRSMVNYYSGSEYTGFIPDVSPEDNISSAEILQVVRKHLPNREVYAKEVIKYVTDKLFTKLEV